jgi:WD40 repeat protein
MNASLSLQRIFFGILLILGNSAAPAHGSDAPKQGAEEKHYRPEPNREIPWSASADPAPALTNAPSSWGTLSMGGPPNRSIFPLLPSPFVVLSPKPPKGIKDKGLVQVYDLRTGKPFGSPFTFINGQGDHMALATDGRYLAVRVPGKDPPYIIDVIDTAAGKSIRRIEAGHGKEWSFPVAFIGPDRLLTHTHEAHFPDFGEKTEYKVWNVRTGEMVSELTFDLVWGPTSVGLSPGGKYIVFRVAKTGLGNRLIMIELATGKVVGDREFLGKKEPFGGSGAIEFSPDGKEIAILWEYLGPKQDLFGKVLVFDATNGQTVATHDLVSMSGIDTGSRSGLAALQWAPDGSGWLLFGTLLLDRKTGKEIGRVGGDKKSPTNLRRFVGPGQVSSFKGGLDPSVTLEPVRTAGR